MLHVPYKGGGPAVTAVLGGEVQIHFPAGSVGVPHVKAGRLRALGFHRREAPFVAARRADGRRSGIARIRRRRRLAWRVRAGENARLRS